MAVITISRQLGCRGSEIANKAAELLEYDIADKELITNIAHMAGVPEAAVERYDETVENPVVEFLRGLLESGAPAAPSTAVPSTTFVWTMDFPYEVPAVVSGDSNLEASEEVHFLDQDECLRFVQSTIQHLWRRGHIVLVGRGAQRILAGLEDVLHVRLFASEEFRIERVMDANDLDYKEARELVRNSDRRRAAYLHRHYHVDWADPTLYHIDINTEQTGVDLAAEIIAAGAHFLDPKQEGAAVPQGIAAVPV